MVPYASKYPKQIEYHWKEGAKGAFPGLGAATKYNAILSPLSILTRQMGLDSRLILHNSYVLQENRWICNFKDGSNKRALGCLAPGAHAELDLGHTFPKKILNIPQGFSFLKLDGRSVTNVGPYLAVLRTILNPPIRNGCNERKNRWATNQQGLCAFGWVRELEIIKRHFSNCWQTKPAGNSVPSNQCISFCVCGETYFSINEDKTNMVIRWTSRDAKSGAQFWAPNVWMSHLSFVSTKLD